jgi:hypothetical protein
MIGTTVAAAPAAESRPWVRAICWLLFLTPFFYLSYGAANEIAASRLDVPSIVFDWGRQIPFLAWTIVPYWSINAFYGLSLLVCSTRAELDGHARRLVTAQIGAVACFVLFPLKFTFRQPHTTGLPGFLFDALTTFDKPFNQAPSLHIALLVILWKLYARHLPRAARWPLHLWFALSACRCSPRISIISSTSRPARCSGRSVCGSGRTVERLHLRRSH